MDETAAALLGSMIGSMETLGRSAGTGSVERRDGFTVQESVLPTPEGNGMFVHGPATDEAIAAMPAIHEDFVGRGRPFGVSTIDGQTPAVDRAAEEMGLRPVSTGTAMRMPRVSFRPSEDRRLRFERVRAADTATWVSLCAAGFEMPPEAFDAILTPQLRSKLDEPWIGGVVAWRDGEAVSTACFLVHADGAAIVNVATPPEHRGNGYASAVTSDAVRRGFEAGAGFAWLQASPMGLGLYERLGFERVWDQTCRAAPSEA